MECTEAKKLVMPYVERKIPDDKVGDFIKHVRSCPSCYDELETHFIVNEAMNQLTEEGETTLDFKVLLEQNLRQAERHVLRLRLQKVLVLWTLITIVILAAGFGFYMLFG